MSWYSVPDMRPYVPPESVAKSAPKAITYGSNNIVVGTSPKLIFTRGGRTGVHRISKTKKRKLKRFRRQQSGHPKGLRQAQRIRGPAGCIIRPKNRRSSHQYS